MNIHTIGPGSESHNHLLHIREEHGEQLQLLRRIMSTLQDIQTKVAAQTDALTTIATNQKKLDADIATLIADLQNGNPANQELIDSINATLDSNSTALAAIGADTTAEDGTVTGALPPPPK